MKRYVNILLAIFLLSSGWATGQEKLEIRNIFETYGKKQGSILIELGTDVLGSHTKISNYKSLILPSGEKVQQQITEAIEADIKEGAKLLEEKKDGNVETGYYCLKKDEKSAIYEYILYKNKSKKITLIYLQGNFSPRQLEEELDKLKDLFITVNKKRIKL